MKDEKKAKKERGEGWREKEDTYVVRKELRGMEKGKDGGEKSGRGKDGWRGRERRLRNG